MGRDLHFHQFLVKHYFLFRMLANGEVQGGRARQFSLEKLMELAKEDKVIDAPNELPRIHAPVEPVQSLCCLTLALKSSNKKNH